jgi:hypothetical protein
MSIKEFRNSSPHIERLERKNSSGILSRFLSLNATCFKRNLIKVQTALDNAKVVHISTA